MEDLIAIMLVLGVVAGVTLAARAQWRMWQRHKKWKAEQAEAEQKRQIEATRKWREGLRQKQTVAANSIGVQAGGNVAVGVSSSNYKPSYAPSPTQSIQNYQSDNTLSDLANIAIIANTINHWNDHSRTTTKNDDYSPVTSSTSSSSWGLDDDDSRKSASSSFSSSDSSSSWSSSSSDSGPSSDW